MNPASLMHLVRVILVRVILIKNNFSIDVCLSRDTRERTMLIMWLVVIRTLCSIQKKKAWVKYTLDFAD